MIIDGQVTTFVNVDLIREQLGLGDFDEPTLPGDIEGLTTDDVAEASRLYFTQPRARTAISAQLPITYESASGVIGCFARTDNAPFSLVLRDSAGNFTAGQGNFTALTTNTLAVTTVTGNPTFSGIPVFGTLSVTTVNGNPTFSGNVTVQGNFTTNLTANSVPFIGAAGVLSQDNARFTWDNTNKTLQLSALSATTSCAEMTKTEHSSANQSAFRLKDSTGQECVGFSNWNGGGGTGGYGTVVLSSTGGAGIRLGEIGGKNNSNGFRVCDFIFQTGSAGDNGEIVTLLGTGGGAFAFAQYIGANGTGFKISSAPTAKVHIAAGSTTASTAPIKLTSGSLLTAAEAGAVEFLTDKLHFTISTGAARKEITLNDAALTSGTIPVATTNGRLTDSAFTTTTLQSGTYTPTLTNVANLDASTAYACQYMRVGATITVSGKVDVDPTAAGNTQLGISLPVASALTQQEQCAGTAFASGIAGQGAAIRADATNDRAELVFIAADLTNQPMYFQFTYRVL